MKQPYVDLYVELTGSDAEVQKMLDVAPQVESAIYKKEPIDGGFRVWYRAKDGKDIPAPKKLLVDIKAAVQGSRAVSKPKDAKTDESDK